MIEEVIRTFGLKRAVAYLCRVAGVRRQGYYEWLIRRDSRDLRAEADYEDALLLIEIQERKKGKAGYRTLHMILRNEYGVVMNHKKILRLTGLFGLHARIRRAHPYRKMAKATQEHRTVSNHLNREFQQDEPGKVLLTDITYLYHGKGQPAYLSTIKDAATKEILVHELTTSLSMPIVYRTLDKLEGALGENLHPEIVLHSDQGFHYTHPEYQKRIKDLNIKQSMSRKGNCWDNAPMESFFGHMKDEIDYRQCQTFDELKLLVDEYVYEYNNHRYQWNLKKMTPAQYRSHLIAA